MANIGFATFVDFAPLRPYDLDGFLDALAGSFAEEDRAQLLALAAELAAKLVDSNGFGSKELVSRLAVVQVAAGTKAVMGRRT
jgi:hypothetical protein